MEIPERLQETCPNCSGKGEIDAFSFSDPATVIQKRCRVCNRQGWLWSMDQEAMAQEIARLDKENIELLNTASIWRNRAINAEEELAGTNRLAKRRKG